MSNPRNGRTIRVPVQTTQRRLLADSEGRSRLLLSGPGGDRSDSVEAKPALEDELRARVEELHHELKTWKSQAHEWQAAAGELEQQVSSLESEIEDWKTKVAKLQAREADVRRQAAHQAQFQTQQERLRLLGRLLSVADDLERALLHADEQDPLRSGVEITLKGVLGQLRKEGVEPLQVLGHRFDPNLHEAVGSDGSGGDQVVKVVRTGYSLDGGLLRPAQVVVGRLSY